MSERPQEEEDDGGDEDGGGGGCGGRASPAASSFDAFHLLPPFDLAPLSRSLSFSHSPSLSNFRKRWSRTNSVLRFHPISLPDLFILLEEGFFFLLLGLSYFGHCGCLSGPDGTVGTTSMWPGGSQAGESAAWGAVTRPLTITMHSVRCVVRSRREARLMLSADSYAFTTSAD